MGRDHLHVSPPFAFGNIFRCYFYSKSWTTTTTHISSNVSNNICFCSAPARDRSATLCMMTFVRRWASLCAPLSTARSAPPCTTRSTSNSATLSMRSSAVLSLSKGSQSLYSPQSLWHFPANLNVFTFSFYFWVLKVLSEITGSLL